MAEKIAAVEPPSRSSGSERHSIAESSLLIYSATLPPCPTRSPLRSPLLQHPLPHGLQVTREDLGGRLHLSLDLSSGHIGTERRERSTFGQFTS